MLVLTSLRRPHCDHLVGLVKLAEALREHLNVVRRVWFQHGQFVGGLVAVRVHGGPLLRTHEPGAEMAVVTSEPTRVCVHAQL